MNASTAAWVVGLIIVLVRIRMLDAAASLAITDLSKSAQLIASQASSFFTYGFEYLLVSYRSSTDACALAEDPP